MTIFVRFLEEAEYVFVLRMTIAVRGACGARYGLRMYQVGRRVNQPLGLAFFFFSLRIPTYIYIYIMLLLGVTVKPRACLSVVNAILVGRIFRRAFGFDV